MNTTQRGFVVLANNGRSGVIIAGPPHILSRICESQGFKNPCLSGQVGLTAPKAARLRLTDAVGVLPNWHRLSREEITRHVQRLLEEEGAA